MKLEPLPATGPDRGVALAFWLEGDRSPERPHLNLAAAHTLPTLLNATPIPPCEVSGLESCIDVHNTCETVTVNIMGTTYVYKITLGVIHLILINLPVISTL